VSRGLTEEMVAKLGAFEESDLPERTKWALRLADRISAGEAADEAFYAGMRRHFSDDQILDLGMTIGFMFGWQRFIEAFGIVPDRWTDGAPRPWEEPGGPREFT